jgi:hypothetical protein
MVMTGSTMTTFLPAQMPPVGTVASLPDLRCCLGFKSRMRARSEAGADKLKRQRPGVKTLEKQVIEFGGLPVGIAVSDEGELRFIAVKFHVIDLDGRRFPSVGELKLAIRNHLKSAQPIAA